MQDDLLYPSAFQVALRCKDHKQGVIVKGCVDKNCRRKRILLCQQCLNEDAHMEHNQNVLGIKQFIAEFSQSIYQATQQNKNILEQFLSKDDNLKVYKYLQDNKNHLKKVKDNIDTQKTQVAMDMTYIVEQFQLFLQQIKDSVFKKLDSVYMDYEALFEQTRKQFNQRFFPAANYFLSTPMALSCKLGQQGDNSDDYLRKLKTIDYRGLDDIQESFSRLLIANETPKVFESDQQKLYNSIQDPLQNYFLGWFSGERMPPPPSLSQQNSGQQYSSPQQVKPAVKESYGLSDSFIIQKSGTYSRFSRSIDLTKRDWLDLKPARKFTLDFTIGAVISMTRSTYILLGQNDSKIRIFDLDKKSLQAVDGHSQPVNWIEYLSSNSFITGSDDGTINCWLLTGQGISKLETYQPTNKPIVCGLDLLNNCFAFIDSDGRVGYKNMTTKSEYFLVLQTLSRMAGRTKKYKMALIKPGELFYVYIAGEIGGAIIQVSEKDKILRKINANTLPTSQTAISLSLNELLLASTSGIKICATNKDDILPGGDVDIVILEFALSQIYFAFTFPTESGPLMQYRITYRNHGAYEILQKEINLDGVGTLQSRLKPRVQLVKNMDKLQIVIVDQNKINFFDVIIK